MTNRFPLIIDAQTQRISELPSGDNLDLTGNSVSAVRDILPETTLLYDLGSDLKRWRDLYLSGTSIYLGDGIISYNSALNKFLFSKEIQGVSTDVAVSLDGNTTDDLTEGLSNQYFTESKARLSISVDDLGGDGSLIYDNNTGTITYQGPTATEVRSHFSAGTGVSLNSGEISIGQAVGIADNVRFNSVQIDTDLQVDGNVTIGGNIILGNEVLDSVTVVADFTSNLIPNQSNQYDLGSDDKKWRNLYARTANIRQILTVGTDDESTASLTTNATTVNLFNTTATDIVFASDATSLSIGNSSGTTTVNHNLVINGSVSAIGGTVLTEGTGVDQITVFTKSLTLTQDFQDTGINSTDLTTGTYVIQLFANDSAVGGSNNNEYYSGIMSWFSDETDSSIENPTDEIVLHRAGRSSDAGMFLRTLRSESTNPANLRLQVFSNQPTSGPTNYVFKFRRLF